MRITRDQKKTFAVDAEGAEREGREGAARAALRKAEAALKATQSRDADTLFEAFVPMIPAVNQFFDKVLVMAKKKAERENRLGLLQRVAALAERHCRPLQAGGFLDPRPMRQGSAENVGGDLWASGCCFSC